MRPKKVSYKRKKSSKTDGQSNSKYRKINVPTCDSNNNSDSCLMSRHEMLVQMVIILINNFLLFFIYFIIFFKIQQSREDSQQICNRNEVCSTPSTSTDDVKSKYIQQLQEDMNEIDVVDIRKRKLVRMWMQKQNLESVSFLKIYFITKIFIFQIFHIIWDISIPISDFTLKKKSSKIPYQTVINDF